jgi:hypothetical protein
LEVFVDRQHMLAVGVAETDRAVDQFGGTRGRRPLLRGELVGVRFVLRHAQTDRDDQRDQDDRDTALQRQRPAAVSVTRTADEFRGRISGHRRPPHRSCPTPLPECIVPQRSLT